MGQTTLVHAFSADMELRITARSGRVIVRAEERTDISIADGGDGLSVSKDAEVLGIQSGRGGAKNLELLCPSGTNLTVGTGSGHVQLLGAFGAVRVTTGSGRIELEEAAVADLRSGSGDIRATRCLTFCRLQTGSGKAEIDSCGSGELATGSGHVSVGLANGRLRVRTSSGAVDLGGDGCQDLAVQSISGSVRVRLPRHARPAAHLLSKHPARCDLQEGNDCHIAVQTMSGRIEVVSAE